MAFAAQEFLRQAGARQRSGQNKGNIQVNRFFPKGKMPSRTNYEFHSKLRRIG
jgi:hypothetical protein